MCSVQTILSRLLSIYIFISSFINSSSNAKWNFECHINWTDVCLFLSSECYAIHFSFPFFSCFYTDNYWYFVDNSQNCIFINIPQRRITWKWLIWRSNSNRYASVIQLRVSQFDKMCTISSSCLPLLHIPPYTCFWIRWSQFANEMNHCRHIEFFSHLCRV